jgi:hypothetical protein
MYPLSNSSFNYIFSSANSLGVILYVRLEIGAVPDCNSIVNYTSRFTGMPGKSFGKTSGNSQAIGISSRFWATVWCADAAGTGVDASYKVTLSCYGESKCITRASVSSNVRCLLIQLIPKITSIPCLSRTIKHVLYILRFKLRGGFTTTCLVTICSPGVLVI